MSKPPSDAETRRGPRVFRADDPDLVVTAAEPEPPPSVRPGAETESPPPRMRAATLVETGFRWGTLLISALAGAALLSAGVWFARFVSVGLERDDWIGWLIRGLIAVAAIAAVVLLLRELLGWRRLSRLGRLRRQVDAALAAKDVRAEAKAADRILGLYAGRPELRWGVDRVKSHRADVLDPAALLTLVERDLLAPLDSEARRLITTSAKRVATVTALAPLHSIAFGFIVFENLRLLRRLATTYGGRPGMAGGLRLGRTVVGNLIAAGGLALTDDLVGQFIGQDVLRRLSARLGEGAFNGALTARIGVAALAEVRPLPFLAATPLRARDILGEVIRPTSTKAENATK
jgi:putative membrane protein